MGTTLTGTRISDTYDSLLKATDNGIITSSAKQITDGVGNNTPLYISTSRIGIGVSPTTVFQVSGNSKIGGDLTVTGNLLVEGTTTTVDTDTLSVKDPLIIVGNDNNTSDLVDLGFYGLYDTSGSQDLYAGLYRSASDTKFHLFKDLQEEPNTTVNTSGTGYAVASLVANLEGNVIGNVTGDVTGDITGNVTGNVTGNLTGNVTGDVTGNVTGDLTGDVTGNVTGDLTGNVTATSVLANGVTATTQSDGDNSTKVATTAYVDTAITGHDTLAEILSGGNTTGGTDIAVSAGDDITFTDTSKSIYGTGGELEIHHNGSNSYITEDGTGALYLQGTYMYLTKSDGSQNYIELDLDGATDSRVKLNYGGATKLQTTNTGVDVTGNIIVSGTVDGRDVATDGTKLDGIEAGADVTDATNVLAAGAVMTTGNQSISGVKTFSNQVSIPATPSASTDAASKGYVDAKVTAEDLDFAGTSGTGSVDLDSQTFTIAGTTNEISTSASNQTLTVGLPTNVTIQNDLTVLSGAFSVGDFGVNDEPDYIYADNSLVRIGYYSNIKTFEVNQTDFRVGSNHKVGIGTNDPQTLFEVSNENIGTTTAPIIRINNLHSNPSNGQNLGSIEFYNDHTNSTTANIGVFHSTNGTIVKEMTFNLGSQGDILRLAANEITATKRFTVANNVTIEAPSTSGGAILKLENTDTSVSSTDYLGKLQFISNDDSNSASGIRASIDAYVQSDFGATDLIFSTAAYLDQTAIERMRIDANGNISFQSGAFVVEGDGISINNDDNLRLLFTESGGFKAGLQVATTADDMITGSAVNDFCIRSNFNMLFAAGSVERLRIDSSGNSTFAGNVGINETSLTEKLEVDGAIVWKGALTTSKTSAGVLDRSGDSLRIRAYGATAGSGNLHFRTGGGAAQGDTLALTIDSSQNATFAGNVNTGRLFVEQSGADMIDMTRTGVGTYRFAISSSDAFSLFDVGANADRLVIDSSGNVGIGTTSPDATLSLENSQSTAANNTTTGSIFQALSPNSGIFMRNRGASAGIGGENYSTQLFTDSGAGNFEIYNIASSADLVLGTNATERLRIDSSGIVKINERIQIGSRTSGDSSIISQSSDIQLRIGSTSNSNNPYIRFQGNNGSGGTYADIQLDPVNQLLKFNDPGTSSGSIGTNPMVLDSSGRVGIGTASPTNPLSVEATNVSDWVAEFKQGHSTTGQSYGVNIFGGTNSSDAAFQVCNQAGSGLLRVTGAGNVLVGKSTDDDNTVGCRLANFGLVSATRSGNVSGIFGRTTSVGNVVLFRQDSTQVGSISLTASATSYNTNSDYRLKEDLQDFNGLDKVSKIPVYDFKWKTDESRSYGVIAHELQEVLPDAVSGDKDAEEMQGVDYSKIVPLLVKSIQELQKRIEILENK